MTQFLRPISPDISAGTWTPSTGITLWGCIDEVNADTTDYISNTSTSASTCEVTLNSVVDPETAANHTINVQAQRTATGASCTCFLIEGSTVRATFTVTVGQNNAQTNYTLNAGEANNIGNYGNLRLRFTGARARVNWAQFQVPDPPVRAISITNESIVGVDSVSGGLHLSTEINVSDLVLVADVFGLGEPERFVDVTDQFTISENINAVLTPEFFDVQVSEQIGYTPVAAPSVSEQPTLLINLGDVGGAGGWGVSGWGEVGWGESGTVSAGGEFILISDSAVVYTEGVPLNLSIHAGESVPITEFEDVENPENPPIRIILSLDGYSIAELVNPVVNAPPTLMVQPGIGGWGVFGWGEVGWGELGEGADSISLTDSASASVGLPSSWQASVSDGVSLADTPVLNVNPLPKEIVVTQSIAVADAPALTVSAQISVKPAVIDLVAIDEDQAAALSEPAAVQVLVGVESIGAQDSVSLFISDTINVSEAIAITDESAVAVSEQADRTPFVSDNCPVHEVIQAAVGLTQPLNIFDALETVSFADEPTADVPLLAGLTPWILDAPGFFEAVTLEVTPQYLDISVSEAYQVAEVITSSSINPAIDLQVSDTVTVGEAETAQLTSHHVEVIDYIVIEEGGISTSSSIEDVNVEVVDLISISENELVDIGGLLSALQVKIQEQIAVGETTFGKIAINLAAIDSVNLSENVHAGLLSILMVAAADRVAVTESVAAVKYGFTGNNIIYIQPRLRQVQGLPGTTESHKIEAEVLIPGREVKGGS